MAKKQNAPVETEPVVPAAEETAPVENETNNVNKTAEETTPEVPENLPTEETTEPETVPEETAETTEEETPEELKTPTPPTKADLAHAEIKSTFPIPPEPFQEVAPMLYAFCLAITKQEVYAAPGEDLRFPAGSRSYFDHNPGNLRFRHQEGSIGQDKDSFALFPDYNTGFKALIEHVNDAVLGKNQQYKNPLYDTEKKLWRPMNLREFFMIYDASHANNPAGYAERVAADMGVSVETTMNQLIA